MTNCPKCSRRVESFAVDTNCAFRMCSNVACTWPFECPDMGRYFDHDATVPSIRKRAKKRKAPKDESRKTVVKRTKTDIFAVLGHGLTPAVPSRGGSVSADAGVPRNSRMNSPATSNSESGADEIDSGILSSDELAMIIGSGNNAISKPQPAPAATAALSSGHQHPSSIATTSLATTGSLFDPISMLLSPPNSASTAISASQPPHSVTAATTSESLDLFSQYYWPSVPQQQQQQQQQQSGLSDASLSNSTSSSAITFSDSTKTLAPADDVPFDLNKYLDSVTAAGNAQSGAYIDAALGSGDIIDDIFGKSSL
ncbi:hypothetical protein LPJ53_004779 [Coemansia erecta]|uniref:Uncharacterized protein n=1 Tax=Coemansia erecta TaxID=147472 RepID=A0A9W7XZ19_9FUNG|nr:hypothetical protein LPJ53_004779 [Coemansia erecta]